MEKVIRCLKINMEIGNKKEKTFPEFQKSKEMNDM